MASTLRFGIIGGNGWLGNALADAAIAAGSINPYHLTLSARSDYRGAVAIRGAYWTKDNAELTERSDIVVLSVRPDQFSAVKINARGKLVVSLMAGVATRRIADQTNANRVVRAMPNAAVSIRRSFTPWFATAAVSEEERQTVQGLFTTCGDADEVPLEGYIDYCVGLTGSGAAFPALLAQAMIEHAVAQGLPLEFSQRAVQGVVVGASQLLALEHGDPRPILQKMMDYRGTTAAGLQASLDRGFVEAVQAGLGAAASAAIAMMRE